MLPGKALPTVIAIRQILPLQRRFASRADGKHRFAGHIGKRPDLHDRHRRPIGEIAFLYAQKVVGRFMKAKADLLKDVKGRVSAFADNVDKVLGTALAPLGSPLIAEALSVAELKKRSG